MYKRREKDIVSVSDTLYLVFFCVLYSGGIACGLSLLSGVLGGSFPIVIIVPSFLCLFFCPIALVLSVTSVWRGGSPWYGKRK